MAAKVGVIDTSLIKEEEKHKRRDKDRREKHHHREKDIYEDFKKSLPECIAITRDVEKRKEYQKAKERARAKRAKHRYEAKYGKRKKHSSKHESYGDTDEYFHGPRSGFSNGGAYRYKTGGYKK